MDTTTRSFDNLNLDGATRKTTIHHNKLVGDVDALAQATWRFRRPQVVGNISPALAVDANANDIQMGAAISIYVKGHEFPVAIVDPIDTSTLSINTKAISTSKSGAGWVFAKYDGTVDMQQAEDTAAHNSAIIALAQYAKPTNTLPPTSGHAPIGVVQVTEGGSGAFTWGPDSITAETKTYYSFRGLPGVITAIASFAVDAGAATFTYGAGVIRLGTATVVSLTGKANVTIAGSVVATGAVGAWLVYALADDVEYALQLGATYANLAAAQAAVRDHTMNPLLAVIGVLYVENNSGADFTPGTTNLDARGVTTTCTIATPIGDSIDGSGDFTAAKVGDLNGNPFTA